MLVFPYLISVKYSGWTKSFNFNRYTYIKILNLGDIHFEKNNICVFLFSLRKKEIHFVGEIFSVFLGYYSLKKLVDF